MPTLPTLLDFAYQHEQRLAQRIWLSQPIGNGEVREYTWAETMDQARRMATYLQSVGVQRGDRVAILSKNCAEFAIAELAIWIAGGVTVAIFPTETAKTVRYVLQHSEARALFVGKLDDWSGQCTGVEAALPCIAFSLAPKCEYPRWDALLAKHAPLTGQPLRGADDMAMLIYTSGSTGQPKGVLHSFATVTEVAERIAEVVQETIGANTPLRMLSYLPLAHVVERAWVLSAAYANGKTHLYFSESLETFLTDLRRARPTVFVSVPRLWLKFQHGVLAKMPAKKLNFLIKIPLLGRYFARKVLISLGLDCVKLAGSGSAPISSELLQWYRALGLRLLEGYGMSEDFAYSNSSIVGAPEVNFVGRALPGVQVRIAEDGEILIKSPGTFVGYFKQPELYQESFDAEGFFKTGDLGQLRPDGLLRITGRKKELFKTAKGKYVAPAPIENKLTTCPIVDSCMVSGAGQVAPYALIVLNELERNQLKAADPELRAQITATLSALLKEVNATLPDYEKLAMLVVYQTPLTVENGCLTPTLKLKRNAVEASVEAKLEGWYAQKPPVVWDSSL